MKTIGIIGGAGFIGSYNTQKFLSEGYRVRVSTTDLAKPEKYAHLQQLPQAQHLDIVELDVANKAQLQDFLTGCQVVVHGGTPFQLDVQDPKTELFDPTIRGTENFLELIQQIPGLEKVVFIASVAAFNTNFPLLPEGKNPGDQVSEADAPFMSEASHPYAQAKFLANQAVDRFIAEHPDMGVEIVTVSPVGVMGKALSQRPDSTSTGLQYLFQNKIAPNPFIQLFYDQDIDFAIVDVADVAEGVFQSATRTGLHGKNYLLVSESYPVSDITRLLNHQEPAGPPKIIYRNDLARRELGMDFRPAREPLMAYAG